MKAVVFHGIGDIRVDDVPEPRIEQDTDAIVRLTAAAIGGTDLHFIRGTMEGVAPGTVGQFAIASAKLMRAGRIFAVDAVPDRLEMARAQGAEVIDFDAEDPVQTIHALTGGIGVGLLDRRGGGGCRARPPWPGGGKGAGRQIRAGSPRHRAARPTRRQQLGAGRRAVVEACKAFDTRQPGWIKVELAEVP
ncbi:hypothetical protein GCM10023144_42900 [Pigmentiphaga soli]|uniref:Alcohol dehydrogenase-like C-terminal domain-containing protein n=1 Tax=Pigmentiphaga soli TaxID=1007095 RepID=A0ABP8HNA5_9BURK